MSHHRPTPSPIPLSRPASARSASWTCHLCQLSAMPSIGPCAAAESELLAGVHDRLHHGGARTAVLVLAEQPHAA